MIDDELEETDEPLISVTEAARRANLTRQAIQNAIRRGKLAIRRKFKYTTWIDPDQLRGYLATRRQRPRATP